VAAGCGIQASGGENPPALQGEPSPGPFKEARRKPLEYAGPGRDEPAPDVSEVRIGWFGPSDPDHPLAGQMWQAAGLAVEEANEAGGYRGLPFRLTGTWSENPWGSGIRGVTRLVYQQGVWAMAGAPDSASAHLVEQVVAKARLAFLSPVSTDRTANQASVPWIFSCAPGDHLLAPLLARALLPRARGRGLTLISTTDHDSRMATGELLRAMEKLRIYPTFHLQLAAGNPGMAARLDGAPIARSAQVVVVAPPRESAWIVAGLRERGFSDPIFGGPAMGRRPFLESAGPAAGGVTFPLLWYPPMAGEAGERFASKFRKRFGTEPDYSAAYTYDALSLLIAAIRKAGLNRARIRDAVEKLSPWAGVTGRITWDPVGQNQHTPVLGTIQKGRRIPRR